MSPFNSLFTNNSNPSTVRCLTLVRSLFPHERELIDSRWHPTGPEDGSDIPSSTILFCSSVSKMIASVATYPHEVLRTRLQIQKNQLKSSSSSKSVLFEGLLPTFRRILREEGLKGFYRGMGVNLLRTVPSSAVTLLVYEKIMSSMLRITHPEDYDPETGKKVKKWFGKRVSSSS